MLFCGIYPVPNTMAFGGVATGNMNAHEAARAKGITSCEGSVPNSVETAIKIGTNRAAVAVLLDSSVKKITKVI